MKIRIKTPNSPYESVLDPGVNEITIDDPHIGIRITNSSIHSRSIAVSARDDGFEICLNGVWYDTYSGEIRKTKDA